MKKAQFKEELIYPIFYNEGLLFKRKGSEKAEYFLYKDNSISIIDEEELKSKEIYYPENLDEIVALKNAVEFIYNRFLISQKNELENELFQILKEIMIDIEMTSEEILFQKLKLKFEEAKK